MHEACCLGPKNTNLQHDSQHHGRLRLFTTIGRRLGIPPNGGLGSGNRPKHSGLLGGGFKCFFLCSPRSLGKWSNLPNLLQMVWNHQLEKRWKPLVVEGFFRGLYDLMLIIGIFFVGRNGFVFFHFNHEYLYSSQLDTKAFWYMKSYVHIVIGLKATTTTLWRNYYNPRHLQQDPLNGPRNLSI